MSEESLRKRQRQDKIGIQTNILAWSVEFLTGLIMLVNYLLGIDLGNKLYRIFVTIDTILCTIVIPACYLFKTERVRKSIYNNGWIEVFTRSFLSRFSRTSPSQDIPMNQLPNNADVLNNVHDPVPEVQINAQMLHNNQELDPNSDENWWMKIDIFDDE